MPVQSSCNLGLIQRLTISSCVALLLFVAMVVVSIAHFEVKGRSSGNAQRLKGDLQTLATVLAAPASAGDSGAVTHVLEAFAARAGIERVSWTDPGGRQIAVSGAPVSRDAPGWFATLVGLPDDSATQGIVVGSIEHGQVALRLNPAASVNEAWALITGGTPIVLGGACALSLALLLAMGYPPLLSRRQIGAVNSLSASERLSRRLAVIVEQSNDSIMTRDLNGTILSWNTGAERLYGWTAEEAIGKSGRELHLRGVADADYALMLARMRAPGNWTAEGARLTKAGTTVQVSVTLSPLLDENGHVVGEVGIGREITALKQAQCALVLANEQLESRVRERTAELSLKEALLRAVMDAMPGVVVFLDAQQRHQLFNRQLEEWLALDADAIRGKTLCEVSSEENLRICLPYLEQALAGKAMRFEWLYRSPDGGLREVDTTLVPLQAGSGASAGVASFSMDISERKRADATLRDSLARNRVLATMVDRSTDSIHARDLDGNVTYWNQGAERVTGFSALEAIGQPLRSLHLREKNEAELAAILARVRSGRATDFEGPRLNKSGQTIDVAIRTAPLFDEDNRLSGEVCVLRDITEAKNDERELRRAKEAAEAANRAKSEFLANMSHEIRTPLNGVLGLTELVLDSELTREQRADLELVQAAGRSLMTILNDILDFSKIEAGQLQIETFEFAPADSIADTLKLLAPRARQKGLTLSCDARDIPPRLLGDPGRLRQIVMNLVGNAIKFTAQGEVAVTVSTLAADNHADSRSQPDSTVTLQVSVRDSGIGIAPDQHATIFDAFTQADASTTRRYGGTGLGLSICAKLVRLMGGSIRVESVADQGSTFTFTIKCGVPTASPAPAQEPMADSPEALDGHTVLVVEDNSSYREALLRLLSGWGMVAAAASDGASALAMLHQANDQGRPYALLLLDVLLPGMDGYAVAQQVKLEPHLAGNVVVLTGAGQRGDAARWLELGAAAYLSKPVQASELFEALVALISRPAGEAPSSLVTRHSLREARQGASILVAEDNETNQLVAGRVLTKLGHRVQLANNGQEALDAIARETFDLVLMDMQMPGMGGLEAAAAIRSREAGGQARLPIVALTAGAMQADRDSCLAAGMDDYLAKPYSAAQIDAVIKRWLPGKRGRTGEAFAGHDADLAAFNLGTQALETSSLPIVAKQDPPVAKAQSLALDVEVLKGCIGDDHDGVDEFLRSYLESSAKSAVALHEAHRARRPGAISSVSHSLKSTARTVGAIEVGELCAQLEAAGQRGDWVTIDAAMVRFDALLGAAAAAADEWLTSHST